LSRYFSERQVGLEIFIKIFKIVLIASRALLFLWETSALRLVCLWITKL
jgi:hypothetical protein